MIALDSAAAASGVAKSFRGGTHRVVAPSATYERVRPLLPAMGITRVANVTGLDCIGIPVVMVCRPNARSVAVSQGKGLDLWAAKASGVMEAIELYHAEHIIAPLKLATYEELRYRYPVANVAALPHGANSAFHPNLKMLWIEGHDLLHGEPVWVPQQVVFMDGSLPYPPGVGCFATTSNGLASGNHPLEAISHAICEVVERDATTLWDLLPEAARQGTRVDLATVDDPACREVLEKYERASVAVGVWDATSDVGLPTFVCQIVDRDENPFRRATGARGIGCHPTREVALLRALSEAAQSRLTLIAGSRDDVYRAKYDWRSDPEAVRAAQDLIRRDEAPRTFQDAPTHEADTFGADVAWELARLRAVGIERVVAVDLTRSEFGLPVVRVVIPGLEGPLPQIPDYVPGARARTVLQTISS